jgi:TPR repeat protein
MGLPDSERSRAVLIGTSDYSVRSGFPSLPAVAKNIAEFERLLRFHTGLGHVHVANNPTDAEAFIEALQPAIDEAEDLLLFYFSGHGVALDDDVGLTYTASRADKPSWTSVPYSSIREEILASRAAVRMVILDCCHSGKAFGANSLAADQDEALSDLAVIEGSYVLTATDNKTKFASAVGRDGCTAFTGALLDILQAGSPSSGEFLTMASLFPLLRRKLKGANLPTPKCSGSDTASRLALVRNLLWTAVARQSMTEPRNDEAKIVSVDSDISGHSDSEYFRRHSSGDAAIKPGAAGDRQAASESPDRVIAIVDSSRLQIGLEEVFRPGAVAGHPDSQLALAIVLALRNESDAFAEAEKWLRKAATAGSSDAKCHLGNLLMRHDETLIEEAVKLWQEAADAGNNSALIHLDYARAHWFYAGESARINGQLEDAKTWYRKAADRNMAEAQFCLGRLLHEQDGAFVAKVEQWWRRAANGGIGEAQYSLAALLKTKSDAASQSEAKKWMASAASTGNAAALYEEGALAHERKDIDQARSFWHQAANAGSVDAQLRLGSLAHEEGEPEAAAAWWGEAAKAGDPGAQLALGDLADEGGDRAEAEKWWHRAALKGQVDAQLKLGLTAYGHDDAAAARWLRSPAESGNTDAKYRMGCIAYNRGDSAEAVKWTVSAAEAGNRDAQERVGELLFSGGDNRDAESWLRRMSNVSEGNRFLLAELLCGKGDPDSVAEAETLWRQAAEAGNTQAQWQLGAVMYKRGDRDALAEAERWWRRAAKSSELKAQEGLANLLYQRGDPLSIGEAETWWRKAADQGSYSAEMQLRSLHCEKDRSTTRINELEDSRDAVYAALQQAVPGLAVEWLQRQELDGDVSPTLADTEAADGSS